MAQSQRERRKLHKRIGKAIQQRTQAIVTANEVAMAKEPTDLASKTAKALGPKASRGGTGRDRLKAGTYGVGFLGPRGFVTPKNLVGKAEADGGRLASITKGPTPSRERPRPSQAPTLTTHKAGSQRFALDASWAGETLGYDYNPPRLENERVKVRKGKGRWKNHK